MNARLMVSPQKTSLIRCSTVLCNGIDIRRWDILAAIHADVSITEAVSQKDDDVGTIARRNGAAELGNNRDGQENNSD